MTTTKDTDRSARAKRQGRKRHPNGTETFGETERSEASAALLPTAAVGSTLNITTATDGLMTLSSADFDALSDATSADVIAFLETAPSAPDLPGPNHHAIDNIAKQVAATATGLAGIDVEGCTGSWGKRGDGEGAIAYTATTWEMSVDNDYYQQPEPINERELEGTLTFEEFNDGYLPDYDGENISVVVDIDFKRLSDYDGENISVVVDIDFKRLSEEFGGDGGQFEYLQVLEEGANNRADEVHQRTIEGAVKDQLPEGRTSPFASAKGRMELAAIIKQQSRNPHADATSPGWADETSRAIRDAHWKTRMGRQPVFADLDKAAQDKLLTSTRLLADLVPTALNRRARRRET